MNKANCLKSIHGYKVEHVIISRVEQFIDEKIIEYYLKPYNKKDMLTISQHFKKETYEYILKRIRQFESYKNVYQRYIDLSYETLIIVKRSYDIYIENLSLKDKLEQIKNDQRIKNKSKISMPLITTSLEIEVKFDMSYINYIEKYGIPDSGIFHPKKLAEFL
jgi:hypothetical protein